MYSFVFLLCQDGNYFVNFSRICYLVHISLFYLKYSKIHAIFAWSFSAKEIIINYVLVMSVVSINT